MNAATEEFTTVYIVIPVHNRVDATRECLESLARQTYTHFKVVLIDDGSSDETSEYVSQTYPGITLLKGDGNLWWTGATNLGVDCVLRVARENDYVLTLNNDTVLPPNYVETLISLSRKAPKALIGSIALDYEKKNICVDEGIRIHWFSAKFENIKGATRNGAKSFYPVSVLPGRGTLVPRSLFREIGLYDEKNFSHYAADYDFSLRACRAGYSLLLHPDCYLYSKTALTGIRNVSKRVSFATWLKSFGSIKSPTNLIIRFRFGLRHAPLLCRPTFIVCDFLRVIIGSFRNQMRNLMKS